MTKKPSEKNKTWEKDRRDRLNKTFDELAKLLPKFDQSIVWSKIEIIQKAIAYIADLEKRLENYLAAKDPELLKEYKEFVNCLRFYQERNAQLTELLKTSKVTLPPAPVALPQLLLDKPELLPKEENVKAVQMQKPKRQRTRTKKSNDTVADKKSDQVKEEKDQPSKVSLEKVETKPIKTEVVPKPTAIITALGRETLNDAPKAPTPQLLPPVPAKPLLLRIRKLRKRHQRLKLIPRPMFRKCYPHPSRMLKWNFDVITNRKLPIKQRRQLPSNKRLHLQKEKPSKQLKVEFNDPEPLREQSVSPTAAFLLSFPVVTSSMLGGKNVENTDSSVNLENLNNFFTTEEYSKFCDQNTVVGEKILSPLPVENEEKPLIIEKPMTVFTVSAITRPSAPKKTCETNGNRSFDSCFSFRHENPMIGSTSLCGASNIQQIPSKQYSAPMSAFSASVTAPPKLPIKQEQISCTSADPVTSTSSSSENFFPRYNHSASANQRSTNQSQSTAPLKDTTDPASLQTKTNWPVKLEPPRGKSIANQNPNPSVVVSKSSPSSSSSLGGKVSAATKPTKPPYLSSTKNFFYDLPTQNRSSSSLSADPLISASTAAIKSNKPIKSEFPWIPPNTSIPSTCNQNALFTPFDLATIVCDSLTSTSFTFSLATPKSSEPSVVDAGNKISSNSRCNQMNLFLPYEEAQYTPTYSVSQTRSTETQLTRESSWKPQALVEKPKDISADQIFYDCEQSKPQPQQKSHVNWMTSPTTDFTPTTPSTVLPLPPMDFGNQFTGSSTNFDLSFGCRKDSYDDDNQFINWSPTKPLNTDFSTAYSFENFGSNEAPPNKTVKQIFSVSQLVDQTPSQDVGPSSIKKTMPKVPAEKTSSAVKQTFSNIYSAESLIAKKDNTRFYNPAESAVHAQTDYHNSSNYFFSYPNSQNCSENDYLGASAYSTSQQIVKTNSIHPPGVSAATAAGVGAGSGSGGVVNSTFESTATTTNYFSHTISSNNNDPYDPTYFPSSNYNQSWSHTVVTGKTATATSLNIYNPIQGQFGTLHETPSCQQNSNVSGNLTNFNLSSICPEIDGKNAPNGW